MQSASSVSPRRRPCFLDVDDGRAEQRTVNATTSSSVDRLLADIAFQRQKERRRAALRRTSRRRHHGDGRQPRAERTVAAGTTDEPTTVAEIDDEAASAYWWTDVFLRYFVFDDDYTRANSAAADSDDLLFFVRRRRDKRKSNKHRSPLQQQPQRRRRRIVYDTRAYRKQQPQQKPTTMLPIGDPAILWPHTVCLNAIVHRFRYTLTVAVCIRVPRKSAGTGYYCQYSDDRDEFELDDGQDHEYDLQLLSRHVHTVYASTSGRRMDTDKGPRERPVYPAVCWAADDYAEAFRTVIVRPGQTVCAELVAAWPGSTVVTEKYVDASDDDCDGGCEQDGADCDNHFRGRQTSATSVKVQHTQNRAVIFAGAIPYAAVRAAYECKMSLYREAERRRKRRRQRERGGGKKSSLGAALSASLTALFTGGKGSDCPSDHGDCDYYYGGVNAADRVEYVTVRGCRPERGDGDGGELSSGDENHGNVDEEDVSANGNAYYDRTKGLAQMAVALAPAQREETVPSCYDSGGEYQHHQPLYNGEEHSGGDAVYCYDNNVQDNGSAENVGVEYYDGVDGNTTPVDHHQQMESSSSLYNAGTTASEPGDYYDYGWDYETAASSGQQTPQTPSYHYQLQQQQQLERQKRRGGRPRRLSDPCSTSVYDLFDDNCDDGNGTQYQLNQQPYPASHYDRHVGGVHRKHRNHQQMQQKQLNSYGGTIAAVVTPGRVGLVQYPYRAWSESDGLNRCGGGDTGQRKQQNMLPLPPPPVPYYCAAEAAASGFLQFVRKSPGNWWTRIKNHRRRRRNDQQNIKSTTAVNMHRSTSADDKGSKSDCCSITTAKCTIVSDKDKDSDNSNDSGSNSDSNRSNSEDQDSDGEFIGALAAAAAFGHNLNHEWTYRRAPGDPLSDWDICISDSNSDTDDGDMLEWTTEIMATDLRCNQPYQNWNTAAVPPRTTMPYDDFSWYVRPLPPSTKSFNANVHQQHQQLTRTSRQNQRQRRQPPPQLQPQPLEPPPPPPALSVAFTAVACPWWTVLEDLLLACTTNTSERPSSSNKSAASLPLLTFD